MATTITPKMGYLMNELYDSEARVRRQIGRLVTAVNNVIRTNETSPAQLQKLQAFIAPYNHQVLNGNPLEPIRSQSTGNIDADINGLENVIATNRTIFYDMQIAMQNLKQFQAFIDANPSLKAAINTEIKAIKSNTVEEDLMDTISSVDNHISTLPQRATRYQSLMEEIAKEAEKPECNATPEVKQSLQNILNNLVRRNKFIDEAKNETDKNSNKLVAVKLDTIAQTDIEKQAINSAEELNQLIKKFDSKLLGSSSDAKLYKHAKKFIAEFQRAVYSGNASQRNDDLVLKNMVKLLGQLQAEITLHPKFINAKKNQKNGSNLSRTEKTILNTLAELIRQEEHFKLIIKQRSQAAPASPRSTQAYITASMANSPRTERSEEESSYRSNLSTPTVSPQPSPPEAPTIRPVRGTVKQEAIEPIEPSPSPRKRN